MNYSFLDSVFCSVIWDLTDQARTAPHMVNQVLEIATTHPAACNWEAPLISDFYIPGGHTPLFQLPQSRNWTTKDNPYSQGMLNLFTLSSPQRALLLTLLCPYLLVKTTISALPMFSPCIVSLQRDPGTSPCGLVQPGVSNKLSCQSQSSFLGSSTFIKEVTKPCGIYAVQRIL